MKTALSSKGQVTIPKPIRDRLGLRTGSLIEFNAKDGVLIGHKATPEEDPVTSVTGILKNPLSVDDYLADVRGPVE